jgi:REP element-mobilizing transposase RayT
VTARCSEERFFLLPGPELNFIVGTWIARAIKKYEIELFAFVVMGNHWHFVLRAPRGNLSEFMQYLMSQVARKVNLLRERHGDLWEDRYACQPILDDASLIDRMLYCLLNPCKAGLVPTVDFYPGLSSYEANLRGVASIVVIPSATQPSQELAEIPIALPPSWQGVSEAEAVRLRKLLAQEVRARLESYRPEPATRAMQRRTSRLKKLDPFSRPENPARKRAPLCFAATKHFRDHFRQIRRAFVAAYHRASEQFRAGIEVLFPAGSFVPRVRLCAIREP